MKLEGYSKYEIYPEEGKIWSYKRNKFLKGTPDSKGYLTVDMSNDDGVAKKFKLHRIIWQCVNGDIPDNMQVNHIDECKQNNSITNLNLMTCKENINWGTGKLRSAINRINHPLKSKYIISIKNGKAKFYPSMMEAERNGFHASYICKCCKGILKTAYGYKWQYVDDYLADWWEQEMDKI